MKAILNHRVDGTNKRTMEALATMSLPSTKGSSIASAMQDELALLPDTQGDDDFRYAISTIIMSHWSECLKQTHVSSLTFDTQIMLKCYQFEPVSTLSDLLMFLLFDSTEQLSTALIPQLTRLCLATIDLIAVPTARAAQSTAVIQGPIETLKQMIEPVDYLDFLHLMAFNCYPNVESLTTFWSAMEFDFVLIMLHRGQPVAQITLMLQLLSTSILPDSFGSRARPRNSESGAQTPTIPMPHQSRNENALLDRLTVLLFEVPSSLSRDLASASGEQTNSPSPTALPSLRTAVLSLLTELADSPYGAQLLATHRLVFGRLVRFLHDAILAMYNYCPTLTALPAAATVDPAAKDDFTMEPPPLTAHDHYTTHVNLTVLLLALLTEVDIHVPHPPLSATTAPTSASASALPTSTSPPTTTRLDVRAKLSLIPGGSSKHLVSLSRIAFADGLTAIERGIEAEAADAAHRMLDELLSPEEGEDVMVVFGGGTMG